MENNLKLSISENGNPNYLATICKIENLYPIENADRLVRTVVNGFDMVVSKETQIGDIVVYFPCESQISRDYLSANNLYELSEYIMNDNSLEVHQLLLQNKSDEAKALVGFFNKRGRVRILKLRGQYSMGFIAGVNSLEKAYGLKNVDWNNLIGTQFDSINDQIIVKKYIPIDQTKHSVSKSKTSKQKNTFDRLIPGEFEFHYDTTMLAEHIKDVSPEDVVSITVKCHGTSVIISNVLCNKKLTFWEKVKKFFGAKVQSTEYGNVYSSRKVIKNRYINPTAGSYYPEDVWGFVNRDFSKFLDQDMTVYGEIVGYVEGTSQFIQKNHDYGCEVGTWKFMPYRIVSKTFDGQKYEWNVSEVVDWTNKIQRENPTLRDKILPLNVLYHGKFKNLFPEINVDENWHILTLEKMKQKGNIFGMELKEPMCKNTVPREGIVLRIDNDKFPRAWKLKTKAHYELEAKQHDAGDTDMEELS